MVFTLVMMIADMVFTLLMLIVVHVIMMRYWSCGQLYSLLEFSLLLKFFLK
jgi:hypothetical protein